MRPIAPKIFALAASMVCACVANLGVVASASSAQSRDEGGDELARAFRDPPDSARPRVWWHWLNGNITEDGIRKDLEWMRASGIGGVQTFDVNFFTPQIVKDRLAYMSPQWRQAFRYAFTQADRLGLEMTIASSPGWSETGGPWVAPADGMKKLVWSETEVIGGQRLSGPLALPPRTTGPFQELALAPEPDAKPGASPTLYADVAILAFPTSGSAPLADPRVTLADGRALDAALLTDGKFGEPISIARSADPTGTVVSIAFDGPQTVRSLDFHAPGGADLFNGEAFVATLEAERAGGWVRIADFAPSLVPGTIGFAPVTASRFRVRIVPVNRRSVIDTISAPGYAGSPQAPAPAAPSSFKFTELRLSADPRINAFQEKAGFSVARDYYALETPAIGAEQGISPGSVIDLSDRLRADGSLDWLPPKGHWRIVRLGYSLVGKTNHPAPAEATGLEVDKLDGAAVRRYMRSYLDTYRAIVGADGLGAKGVAGLLTDSTEVGAFNWTPKMLEQFRRLRGYDARPWLPALTGVIVGSRQQSDAFLYDFRRTIADLHASEHYGVVAQVAHANGMKVYGEALEGWRVSLGDDMDMRRHADIPMAAMWVFPRETGPRPLLLADLRTAASSAHLLGKPIVAAESLTSSRFPWAQGPADLRRVVDLEFANGVNRIVIHTSPHQPVDDKQPGLSLRHIGQFFTRNESWASMARPWMDYIARSSLLLQRGRFVADVAYFIGEEAPAGVLAEKAYFADAPRRHGHDLVNATAIRDLMRVDKGDLVTNGGARYRLLYLAGSSNRMTLPVLRRVAMLVEAGATVVGDPPTSSPAMADDPRIFAALVKRLWSGAAVTRVGKGRVVAGTDLDGALVRIGVAPDFDARTMDAPTVQAPGIDFVHRRLDDGDVYFVRNAGSAPVAFDAQFRVTGKAPEIWRADTGLMRDATFRMQNGATTVPLMLDGEDSIFVVFRRATRAQAQDHPEPVLREVGRIDANWTVAFQPGRGAPSTADMPMLRPLNESADAGTRYFSGVSTYRAAFVAPPGTRPDRPLFVDLGAVGDLAEVSVNGQPAGTAWHAPYRLDVSRLTRPGRNVIEVRVANLWVNRLIGDAQPGAAKIAWTSAPMYRADAPLRPSGLIGPVRLLAPTVP
jgi:hypothetical protein